VTSKAQPVPPKTRLASVDCLRGLALFGVLAINLETEFRVSIFAQFLPHAPQHGWNGLIDSALRLLAAGKAFALFSFLFGAGLAIQHERLAASGRRVVLLVRRLLALLAFGLIHLLFIWNGDILTEYALAGLFVLPLLWIGTRGLAAAAILCLALYLVLPLWAWIVPIAPADVLTAHIAAATRAYGQGGFGEVLAFRFRELPMILPLHLQVLPRTLGLMLLGALLWRSGFFTGGWSQTRYAWPIASGLVAAGLLLELRPTLIGLIAPQLSPVLLALGYAALVVVAVDRGGRRWLGWAEPVGRMAFTNYLLQSVAMGFLFYGYGLGLFGQLDLVTGLAIVLALFGAQIVASRLWLAHFRYGPVEWLWRRLMYGAGVNSPLP